jgi:hypothetical protein
MLARFAPTAGRRRTRRGMTAVESALVLSAFLMLLFGMFEYCRFLLVLHVTNNAARDGARYAAVNLDKPSNFPSTDFTDSAGKVYPSVQRYTRERMGGVNRNIDGFRVAVFSVDPDGLLLTPAVVRPKSSSTGSPKTYPDPFATNDPNAVPWNQCPFPDRLAVTIDGYYHPFLPAFLMMPDEIHINITAMTTGEG